MAKYIELEALFNDIEESVVFTTRPDRISLELRGANKIIDRINRAPSVDVVEVVRCKDCGYFIKKKDYGICNRPCEDVVVRFPNDYCSLGRRREGV